VLGTEVEHFLRLRQAADERTGKLPSTVNQIKTKDRSGLRRGSYQRHRSISFQQIQVGVQIVRGGNSVEDEVKSAGVFPHLGRILRNHNFLCAEP
jgi:hypothetical protein